MASFGLKDVEDAVKALDTTVSTYLRSSPVIDIESFLINKGRAFTVSNRVSNLGNGDSLYLYLDNPDGSGYDYDVVLLPRATSLTDLDVSFGATENDSTAATARNLKSGSSRTFSGTASTFNETADTGTAPSHGTTIYQDFIPGGTVGANISAQVVDAIGFTIDEGSNKLLQLMSESGGTRVAMNVVVFEVDGTYKEIE